MQKHNNNNHRDVIQTVVESPYFFRTGDIDYSSKPVPSVLTIERGQEEMCSIITIFSDAVIEMNETFTATLSTLSTNFGAGVILQPDSVTIHIVDRDGK